MATAQDPADLDKDVSLVKLQVQIQQLLTSQTTPSFELRAVKSLKLILMDMCPASKICGAEVAEEQKLPRAFGMLG
jgi:hypothetical protein